MQAIDAIVTGNLKVESVSLPSEHVACLHMPGSLLGMMSDRGRGTIMHVDVDTLYNNVALGLLSTVSGLKTFGAHRAIFRREAASGLNKYNARLHAVHLSLTLSPPHRHPAV